MPSRLPMVTGNLLLNGDLFTFVSIPLSKLRALSLFVRLMRFLLPAMIQRYILRLLEFFACKYFFLLI